MKQWLSHTVVAAIAVIITMFLMNKCDRVTSVTTEEVKIDTIYQEVVRVDTLLDTVYQIVERTTYDTVYKQVPVPVEPVDTLSVYAYKETYEDSSLLVAGNIEYTGQITKHDQMLVRLKDKIAFIPKVTTIYRNRDVITTRTITRQPRLLAGSYITANKFTIQQLGFSATLVDNRFRQFTIGKDVLSDYGWMAGAKIPIFYKR